MYQHQPHSTIFHSKRRRPVKRKLRTILIPILIVVVVIILVVNIVNMLFSGVDRSSEVAPVTQNYLASFTVEEGRVEIIFGTDENANRHTVEQGNLIKLNAKEGIRTMANTRISLKLANNDIIRVDRETTLFIDETRDNNISLDLQEGSIWVVSDPMKTLYPTMLVNTQFANSLLNRGTSASLSRSATEEYINVQKGSLQLEVRGEAGQVLRSLPIGVGQEVTLSSALVQSIAQDNTVDIVRAQQSTFAETDWYKWNQTQNTSLDELEPSITADFMESGEETEPTVPRTSFNITSHFDGKVVSEEYITIEGTYDPSVITNILIDGREVISDAAQGRWRKNHRLTQSGENTLTVTGQQDGARTTLATLKIIRDTGAPAAPTITAPSREARFTTSENTLTLSGTTTADTSSISVNGYTLQRFSPGETRWSYNVSVAIGNLKEGDNTFEVIGVSKGGSKSTPASITITYKPSTASSEAEVEEETTTTATTDEAETTEEEEETTTPTTTTTTTSTSLTAPAVTFPIGSSSTTTEPEVSVRGAVSATTRRVTVNGYTLQQYTPGSTSFSYNAFVRLGTLRTGSNSYTIIAYDASGKASAPTVITINYQPVQ